MLFCAMIKIIQNNFSFKELLVQYLLGRDEEMPEGDL